MAGLNTVTSFTEHCHVTHQMSDQRSGAQVAFGSAAEVRRFNEMVGRYEPSEVS